LNSLSDKFEPRIARIVPFMDPTFVLSPALEAERFTFRCKCRVLCGELRNTLLAILRMFRSTKFFHATCIIFLALLLGSCNPGGAATTDLSASPTTSAPETFVAEALTRLAVTPTVEPTPRPKDYNPLTGLPVADPSLLKLPALLVSISHFPVDARPQAGLSFAPYVFEIYITEGATRFLTAFYGQSPAPEVPIVGDCEVRREPFTQTDLILGNQVWLDSNAKQYA